MLEALLLMTAAGLLLACDRRLGFGNPFQIYFSTWMLVLLAYGVSRDSFITVPAEYLLAVLAAKTFALLLLVAARAALVRPSMGTSGFQYSELRVRSLGAAQLAVCAAAPFAYQRAMALAGGESIFSIEGYIALRSAMTEGGAQAGFIGYFSILSYVVSSLAMTAYKKRLLGLPGLLFCFAASLFYVYLGTGRTGLLLLVTLILVPLVVADGARWKSLIFALLCLGVLFVFVAAMTAKGISAEADLTENLASFGGSLKSYTVAPFLAMSKLASQDNIMDWGSNTLRFPISLLHAAGLIDGAPVPLIRAYAFVPDPTNVYTVYDVYFRDFSYFGFFVPPAFLIFHWWLYCKARSIGGKWTYYYAASVYPLAMQFFQDQYFSLLSIWIQLGFWYAIFLNSSRRAYAGWRVPHA